MSVDPNDPKYLSDFITSRFSPALGPGNGAAQMGTQVLMCAALLSKLSAESQAKSAESQAADSARMNKFVKRTTILNTTLTAVSVVVATASLVATCRAPERAAVDKPDSAVVRDDKAR